MDAKLFNDKVKALFPQAVAISTSCGIMTGADGEDFASWTCSAYATPISNGAIKLGYAMAYTEEEALAEIVKDAARIAGAPKCGCCGHEVAVNMVDLANGILGGVKGVAA